MPMPMPISRPISTIRAFGSNAASVHNDQHGLDLGDSYCNVSSHIASRVGVNLHQREHHPLCTIKNLIRDYFPNATLVEDLNPVVSAHQNFDSLRIPADHVSRQVTDTYYLSTDKLLRCHTSAHQVDLLAAGHADFLVAGDVYRRDEIDASHYPVFHQMEGVKLFDTATASEQDIEADLKQQLEGMAKTLFGEDAPMRWVDAYFPFTHPSMELEVYYQDDWLEVLGCGVIHPQIIQNAGLDPQQTSGWAFGLGLERLAMVLFQIPDIRLFWSTDLRFHDQFQAGQITVFEPYSKYPPCLKDMSFWLNEQHEFVENDLSELVREVAGDLVEQLSLIDSFVHPKTGRTSHCYRIFYRSMDRSLTNEEIDALQEQVRDLTEKKLKVKLR
jgi:phenylalanyl-tRNA synthetase alpha chain